MVSRSNTPDDFWKRVDKSGECWIWTGQLKNEGYGSFRMNGTQWRSHRLAWTLLVGPIPEGMVVCHNCPGGDNPACVNPAHLFLGTRADNNHDMAAKGRVRQGEQHPYARLTEDLVRKIRSAYIPRQYSYKRVAAQFGIPLTTVEETIRGIRWKSVK